MILVSLLASLIGAATAFACPICLPYPVTTVADELGAADVVLFAREDPRRPFSYQALEVLKGDFERLANVDLFVPTSLRRRLAVDESRVAVLIFDRDANRWKAIGLAEPAYQEFVRRVLLFLPEWADEKDGSRRFEFFANLIGHQDQSIFHQAYLELGRAPYPVIKRWGRVADAQRLQEMLSNRQYMEWRPLAILMLAPSADGKQIQWMEHQYRMRSRHRSTRDLAALATALVEIKGNDAVIGMQRDYLNDGRRGVDEVNSILQALSLHGNLGDSPLREAIVTAYGNALTHHPDLAPRIAQDLLNWGDVTHRGLLKRISQSDALSFDESERTMLDAYLAATSEDTD